MKKLLKSFVVYFENLDFVNVEVTSKDGTVTIVTTADDVTLLVLNAIKHVFRCN